MHSKYKLVPILAWLGLTLPGVAFAQATSSDAADVWSTIERQWQAEENQDDDWVDEFLESDFSGWGKDSPAPRSRASVRLWDQFGNSQGRSLEHELYPLSIVVHGDVAVAHYLYTVATENKDDEVKVKNGRYTDILVRTDDGWKFLAWHGGDDDDD